MKCENPDCRFSTTIAETLSFGSGKLDHNGFWEHPCRTCAAHFEAIDRAEGRTEFMPYHPPKTSVLARLLRKIKGAFN